MALTAGLVCRDLTFGWPQENETERVLFSALTATFAPGTITLITGETGAGKSTLLHLLAGLLRPTAGEICADGQPVSRWSPTHRDRWRRQVGICFQHLALIGDLSAAENLLAALIPRQGSWTTMQNEIHHQLAAVDLADQAGTPARALSGGQRQRLSLARALAGGPLFLLADEPTAFQDDRHTDLVLALLQRAARKKAVVVVCSQDPRLRTATAVDQRLHLAGRRLEPLLSPDSSQ